MYGNVGTFLGAVNLVVVTPVRMEEYQQHSAQQVSPATVNRETAPLKHMFNMGERWQMHHGANPVRWVKFPPENNLQFKNSGRRRGTALARSVAALTARDDPVRNEYRTPDERDFQSEMGGRGYRATTTEDDGEVEPAPAKHPAQRCRFRGHRIATGQPARAICFLQPDDR
jgi:hypothetical protein